jgi:hypothetical protein
MSACTTPYAPSGLTGGFREQKIDETTYRVAFNGNGYTPRDMVWNYWIYRCAELTKSKGFSNFALSFDSDQVPKKTGFDEAAPLQDMATSKEVDSGSEIARTKSSGGTYYYYVPGHTVTTYHANGVVHMFGNAVPSEVEYYFRAQSILDSLRAYVSSNGKAAAPGREEIIKRAGVDASSLNAPSTDNPVRYGNGSLDDFKNLLPAR